MPPRGHADAPRRTEMEEARVGQADVFVAATGRKALTLSPGTEDPAEAKAWLEDSGRGGTDGVVAKRLDGGYEAPVEVEVFKVRVDQLADIYPEHDERSRRWVSPADAAEMVQEPGLKAILLEM